MHIDDSGGNGNVDSSTRSGILGKSPPPRSTQHTISTHNAAMTNRRLHASSRGATEMMRTSTASTTPTDSIGVVDAAIMDAAIMDAAITTNSANTPVDASVASVASPVQRRYMDVYESDRLDDAASRMRGKACGREIRERPCRNSPRPVRSRNRAPKHRWQKTSASTGRPFPNGCRTQSRCKTWTRAVRCTLPPLARVEGRAWSA